MSFTQEILQNNNLNKTCTCCGQKTVYYKKNLRLSTIQALRCIYRNYKVTGVFTYNDFKKDVYSRHEPAFATEMLKHYALAQHFSLIDFRKITKEWVLTGAGYEFIRGSRSVPEYIYGNRKGHYQAEELGMNPAPRLFIQDFEYHDESDATLHYDEALPIPQL